MATIQQQLCDGCGALITGTKGITKVYNEAILIRGSLGIFEVDKETRWRDHLFITPHGATDLAFCKLPCIQAYIDHRTMTARHRKTEALRREASEEELGRLDDQPPFLIGHKKSY